jgi:hypothetical protein
MGKRKVLEQEKAHFRKLHIFDYDCHMEKESGLEIQGGPNHEKCYMHDKGI